jgi:hypothetical protein
MNRPCITRMIGLLLSVAAFFCNRSERGREAQHSTRNRAMHGPPSLFGAGWRNSPCRNSHLRIQRTLWASGPAKWLPMSSFRKIGAQASEAGNRMSRLKGEMS